MRTAGGGVGASDVRGWRPIHHAALHGQTKVVELLIRRGANVNCRRVGNNELLLMTKTIIKSLFELVRKFSISIRFEAQSVV